MTNNTNQALISRIQNNRHQYIKFAMKLCKRMETAEDLIQQVFCVLLTKEIDFEVTNEEQYILRRIVEANWNNWRVNKKYLQINTAGLSGDLSDDQFFEILLQNHIGCSFEEDMFYSLKLKEIRKAAKTLTPGYQKAILNALDGNEIGEELGTENVSDIPRYESLKTNKRLATQKLKCKFA